MSTARSSCLSDFARYASLNVLGMIALSCYILADTFFVSLGMGADGLAALNLAIPVYSFIHGCGLMVGMGGGTRYSIRKNQGDGDSANRAFTGAVYLVIGFAVIFLALGILYPGPLARLLGADGAVFDMTATYLRVILLFSPAFLSNNLLLCFVRNDGAPQLAMAGMITGSLSNVVLDYVFIFPCGMGIFGAALATGFAPLISMAVLSPYLIRGKNRFWPVRCHLRPRRLAAICSAGVPSLVTEVSSGVVMIAFNAILLRLEGNVGVAAYGVIANLSLVVLSIFTGISQGIQPLLSARYGAGKRRSLPFCCGMPSLRRWRSAPWCMRSSLYLPGPSPPCSTAGTTPGCRPWPSTACGCTLSPAPLRGAISSCRSTLPRWSGRVRGSWCPSCAALRSSCPWRLRCRRCLG